jgi:hypothetical protein
MSTKAFLWLKLEEEKNNNTLTFFLYISSINMTIFYVMLSKVIIHIKMKVKK